ncbi:NAD(P)-binding Rossmann-fold superfamily protein [Prunus dulcis]|uniref:NAD(P)-binding Rossmann-fold superfamily protein n=1 Tax=Prunus dulcis TaxID=3755 RepID=A0A4Y1RGP8_PRUDU|nr:NAD(P)-binding Rossmann-fold superfamily protein [Prunus dulcis]
MSEEVTEGIDGTGLTAIVTGASSGIGVETARVLALRGVHVVMAVRNTDAGANVKEVILKEIPNAKIDVRELDLSSFTSVRKFAADYRSSGLPLNILINNAGVGVTPFKLSQDSIELQFATNHLGHFLLTNLLLETMKSTSRESNTEGRIVNVSSLSHHYGYREGIRFDKLNDEPTYNRHCAYAQSKLANILHANELSRCLKEEGVEITANSVHPGAILTNITRHDSFARYRESCGAATTCFVALNPQVKGVGGEYFSDCKIAKRSSQTKDADMARRLWDCSLSLTNPKNLETGAHRQHEGKYKVNSFQHGQEAQYVERTFWVFCPSTAEEVTKGIDGTVRHWSNFPGASSGIGAETSRVLALRGVHVVMAIRNMDAGAKVKEAILEEISNAKIDVMELDLSLLASVRKFAADYNSSGLPLNILINNAGVGASPFKLSQDSIELLFATNHLGHFLLTNLLLETMKSTSRESNIEGRIVNVSSLLHPYGYREGIRFDKINDESGYNRYYNYAQSKLANILHANELTRRLKEEGVEITANSLHPGAIGTNITRHDSFYNGAAMTCFAALHPQVKGVGGVYFSDCNIAKPSSKAKDADLATRLWDFSLSLTDAKQ